MKEQIQKSLLFTGLLSVILSFCIAGILYYQGIQARAIHEIGHLTEVAADGMTDDAERNLTYLEKIREKSERELQISWIAPDGSALFESKAGADTNYLDKPEVKNAFAGEESHAVRNDGDGVPTSYWARQLADGSVLRFAVARTAPGGILSPLLPEVFIFFFVFAIACFIAAEKETDYVLSPLRKVEGLISDIMEGAPERPIPGGYKELRPLVDKVREQKKEIQNYMDDLEEERNTIRTVVNTISDGIILLNHDREIVDCNVRVRSIFQTSGDVRFRKVAVLYHDEDWLRAVNMAYEKEERHEYTMTIYGKPYRAAMAHIELSDGDTGLLIVLHDLTATYAAEKMRREFSANVSHELKTPLTSISGFAEMIANGMYQNETDVKLFASRIFEESRRMMALIETIMHLSKIEERQTTITWKPVDMASIARYVADLIEPQAAARKVAIHVEADKLFVYGNLALLSELVMNCVDNAVKYNKEGGEVKVGLHPEGADKLLLTISDTGIGIPKDKQGRIFERFYRAEESRNKATGGSGLGLAICKHIVSQHKGTIDISSTEGEGTTVRILLPRMSEADVAKEEAASNIAQLEAAKAESGELNEAEPAMVQAEKEKEEREEAHRKNKKAKKEKRTQKEKKVKKEERDKERDRKEEKGKKK